MTALFDLGSEWKNESITLTGDGAAAKIADIGALAVAAKETWLVHNITVWNVDDAATPDATVVATGPAAVIEVPLLPGVTLSAAAGTMYSGSHLLNQLHRPVLANRGNNLRVIVGSGGTKMQNTKIRRCTFTYTIIKV